MRIGEGAAGHERGDDRNPGQLGQLPKGIGRPRLQHPAAHIEHRATRRGDQLGGRGDLPRMRPHGRPVSGEMEVLRPDEGGLRLQNVLRNVHQHRAGSARGCQVERGRDRLWDLGRVRDEEIVFRDRHGDAADVGLLEAVRADHRPADLTGDRDQRHRVHVRVRDRGDQVGGARPRGGHADADLAGRLRVSGGRVPGALLVTDQHVPDPGGVQQRVVHREHRSAGDAEHDLGAGLFQGPHHRRCAGHLLDDARRCRHSWWRGHRRSGGRRWRVRGWCRMRDHCWSAFGDAALRHRDLLLGAALRCCSGATCCWRSYWSFCPYCAGLRLPPPSSRQQKTPRHRG